MSKLVYDCLENSPYYSNGEAVNVGVDVENYIEEEDLVVETHKFISSEEEKHKK
jgi:hypothetical protein